MKTKQLFLLIALFTLTTVVSKAQLKVGAGLHYATDIDNLGISLNGQYLINDDWTAAAGFTYFLETEYIKWSALDFNAHYSIKTIENVGALYGIGGLNITMIKIDIPGFSDWIGESSTSDSNVGLNIGAGLSIDISEKLVLAPEAVYTISSGGYLRIGAKLLFAL